MHAREAFEKANALFGVEKRELQYPHFVEPNVVGVKPSGHYGVVRSDNQDLLGIVGDKYELVQNTSLLRMAEFIREEADIEHVVSLKGGKKVAFTAMIRGTSTEIVPGDSVYRRIVGYLGHDGKTSCGAVFTNVRVFCDSTLATAMAQANCNAIIHKTGANDQFQKLIHSINVARQTFDNEVMVMRDLAQVGITTADFKDFLEEVYEKEIPQGKQIDDLRKYRPLLNAYWNGIGSEFGSHTMWNAVNAVTQVETSTKNLTRKKAEKQFLKANFGSGLTTSARAMEVAMSFK